MALKVLASEIKGNSENPLAVFSPQALLEILPPLVSTGRKWSVVVKMAEVSHKRRIE